MLSHCNKYPSAGEYWVDPNGGDQKDAILVYCNAETKATCVLPKPEKTPEMSPSLKVPGDYWLSDLEGGSQVCKTFYCGLNYASMTHVCSHEVTQFPPLSHVVHIQDRRKSNDIFTTIVIQCGAKYYLPLPQLCRSLRFSEAKLPQCTQTYELERPGIDCQGNQENAL